MWRFEEVASEIHFKGTWVQFARYEVEMNKLGEGETEAMRDD